MGPLVRLVLIALLAVPAAARGAPAGDESSDEDTAAAPDPAPVRRARSKARPSPAKDATDAVPETADASTSKAAEEAARQRVGSPPPPSETGTGFLFGSYGRVGVGIDGRGREGYAVNVSSYGSRLELPPYIELNFYYGGKVADSSDARWRVVLVPAFDGQLFHYSGDFASRFGVRNAYAEVDGVGWKGLNLWAGSRMLRGDDIYLFNWWPLDNLNTVGAGAFMTFDRLILQLHGGLNRQNWPYQYQTVATPARGLGPPIDAVTLDRPRSVASFKLTYFLGPKEVEYGGKLSLYAEYHYLPEGQRTFQTQGRTEKYEADHGLVVGAQLGGWLRWGTFVNLFVRYAQGLGVYTDLGRPDRLDSDRRTWGMKEFLTALSFNYDTSRFGLMGGAYVRYLGDPAPIEYNPYSFVEGSLTLRPQVYLTKVFHIAAELSYQRKVWGGFDPYYDRQLRPSVVRVGLMPIVSPTGVGTYSRPILYAVANLSVLDEDARMQLFPASDIRYGAGTVLYLGVGAEWWFQSSYR